MRRTTQIQLEHSEQIGEASERFGDHEGVNEARILRWLAQFTDDLLPLALDVLMAVRYFDSSNIRAMTRQLFQIVSDELGARDLRCAAFVAVGSPASGSATVLRVLRDALRGTQHRIMSMLDVAQIEPGAIDAIVFLDDFSGTGDTLVSWWETVEPIVRPSNAAIFVGLLLLNEQARVRIEQFAEVLPVTELDVTANVLSMESTQFTPEQKQQLAECCRSTGCGPKYERGYGDCGLLVVLKHGCPNNSLPILWYEGDAWRPLFRRRAI